MATLYERGEIRFFLKDILAAFVFWNFFRTVKSV